METGHVRIHGRVVIPVSRHPCQSLEKHLQLAERLAYGAVRLAELWEEPSTVMSLGEVVGLCPFLVKGFL